MNYFNYFTEIEETFIRRRGRNLLLSPLDWALIENWQEREIPLHIILRAIETVFDGVEKQPNRKRTVKSLSYCKEEIEAQFAEWSEMQTGKAVASSGLQVPSSVEEYSSSKDELFSAEIIENHLGNIVSELEKAKAKSSGNLQETFERVLNRLAELQKEIPTAETLEASLEKLDTLIDESLLISSDGEKLAGLEKEDREKSRVIQSQNGSGSLPAHIRSDAHETPARRSGNSAAQFVLYLKCVKRFQTEIFKQRRIEIWNINRVW